MKPPESQWLLRYLHIVRQAGGGNQSRGTSVCKMGCFPEERGCQEDRRSSVCIKSPLSLQCLIPSTLPQLQPRLGVCPFSFLSLALTLSKEVRLSCLEKKCCRAGSLKDSEKEGEWGKMMLTCPQDANSGPHNGGKLPGATTLKLLNCQHTERADPN